VKDVERICYFCGGAICDDDYCPGCRVFICEYCRFIAEESEVHGDHEPEAHGIPKVKIKL